MSQNIDFVKLCEVLRGKRMENDWKPGRSQCFKSYNNTCI